MAVRSCWILAGTGRHCRIRQSRASQTCSMGDMSGEYAGHARTGMFPVSRLSNLRFVNIPEKSEGRDMISFLNQLIAKLLGNEHFPTAPVIERAHRSPTFLYGPKLKPRPIVVKFQNFQDKVRILRLAREKN